MNWTPGPARCRSDEYEAEIAYTDMPGLRPFSGRVRQKGFSWMPADWTSDGRIYTDTECGRDLMPPTIAREALAEELRRLLDSAPENALHAVVAHVIEAVKSGRVR